MLRFTWIGILIITMTLFGTNRSSASNLEESLKVQVEAAVAEGHSIFIQVGPKAHETLLPSSQSITVADGWVQIEWTETDSRGNSEQKVVWRSVSSVIGVFYEYEENGDNALCIVFQHGF